MYVEVDLRREPPELSLREPEEFRSFKLVTLGSASAVPGTESAAPGTESAAPGTESAAPGTESAAAGPASAAPDTESALDAALERLGTRSGPDHAYLRPDAVAALAGALAAEEAWRESFEAMISFAASKGWCDEVGRVRAHIEHG